MIVDSGKLVFGEAVIKKSAQTAGQASFNSTDTDIYITSPKVKADSLINLTPTTKTNGLKLYIKEIKPNQATALVTAALQFNWFIINQQ